MYSCSSREAGLARHNTSRCSRGRFSLIPVFGLCASIICAEPVLAEGATRDLSGYSAPGVTFTVTITIDPPPSAGLVLVEDTPPAGWTVSAISDAGIWDVEQEKVKWGPFFGPPFPPLVTYDVTPPLGVTGQYCFTGTVFFDSGDEPITGDDCLGDPIPTVSQWGMLAMALLILAAGIWCANYKLRITSYKPPTRS